MPAINLQLTGNGPLVQVLITASQHRMAALQKAGQPVPPPQPGTYLIDTGASGTVVDPSVISALQLSPKNYTPVLTPSTGGTPVMCPVFDVQLIIIPALPTKPVAQLGPGFMPHVRSISVIGAAMKSQGIHGLIGRDVLDQCILIYNGQASTFTLTW